MRPEVLERIRSGKRAKRVVRAGEWDVFETADRVVLDAEERNRRRGVVTGEGGLTFLIDLAAPSALRDGDGLLLDDGSIVAVVALPEPLAEITAIDAAALARLAWHLGNRHTELQVVGDRLRIRRDRVLEDMLRGLGASVTAIEASFEPQSGAYDHGHDGQDSPDGRDLDV
jgi:urease accessory protein